MLAMIDERNAIIVRESHQTGENEHRTVFLSGSFEIVNPEDGNTLFRISRCENEPFAIRIHAEDTVKCGGKAGRPSIVMRPCVSNVVALSREPWDRN